MKLFAYRGGGTSVSEHADPLVTCYDVTAHIIKKEGICIRRGGGTSISEHTDPPLSVFVSSRIYF
jgi:hypothetical protein